MNREFWSTFVLFCISFLTGPAVGQTTRLKMGQESELHSTECGQYGYFEIDVTHPCHDLNIKVKNFSGEPNLYVSPREPPTYRSLAWSSYQWGGEDMTVSSWDPNFRTGRFYIGVHAYCGPDVPTGHTISKYTILVREVPHKHPVTEDLFNLTVTGTVKSNDYERHRFCLPSECFKVEVRLENCVEPQLCPTSYSWPELIVSPTEQFATEKSLAWILGDAHQRSIVFDPRSSSVHLGHYFVTVYGWCTPDDVCHDKSSCGPCSYAAETKYNLSVLASDLCRPNASHAAAAMSSVAGLLATCLLILRFQIHTLVV